MRQLMGLNPIGKELAMRSTQQFIVTLPNDMAADVRAKVESGAYASESEVIRDGLRALQARDRAVEAWLGNVALPAYDACRADPARGVSIDDVTAGLTARG
ncbi:type II toxin-antitoxin system ParD family antitoxin [Sphingobium sp. CR2-8]|uniref:ribbon-helix-helix domain-containing protein n=1 Tax=Sphingobium sp. CR2-8 TaxID=1306534 RepID=UPI002DB67E21|nr:type II toxin-antitoxin system ParD family antitoxin [Sphingobium sp. CR2-8]MEC3911231.1 type II toxin-antitoxin system ParD family antitoxin [Sphingobium sp. CR2-8]